MIPISTQSLTRVQNSKGTFMVSGDSIEITKKFSFIFVELEIRLLNPSATLSAKMFLYPFGDLKLVRSITRGSEHHVMRTQALIDNSTKNNFFIAYVLSGEASLTQENKSSTLRAGDIAILDSTRIYSIDVFDNLDSLWVSVPRHRLEGRLNSIISIMAQRIDGSEGIGYIISSLLQAALKEATRIKTNEANRISNHLLDLISLGLRNPENQPETYKPSDYLKSTLRRIQDYIEARLDDEELTPLNIAEAHSISIRYLSKLFENEGTSTARWIRMRRLERCRSDIESINKCHCSVSEIAYSHGFSNISSFNRAFRQHFKVSPNMLRIKG